MYNTLAKHGTSIAFGLGALVVAIFLGSVFSQIGDRSTVAELVQTNIFDLGLYLTIFMAILCFFAILAFGVFQIFSDLKGSMKGLIGVAILGVVFLGAYMTAVPEVAGNPIFDTIEKFDISEAVSKFVSGAIIATGATLVLATISLVASSVLNFFK